jgi:hypothetical protein
VTAMYSMIKTIKPDGIARRVARVRGRDRSSVVKEFAVSRCLMKQPCSPRLRSALS